MAKRRDKGAERSMAVERIGKLFASAEKASDKALAKRYVTLARRISTKYRVRIPPSLRRRYCRRCDSFWVPGRSVRVRLTSSKMVFTCLECGSISRLPLLK